jgi:hypothetical protein
MRGSGPEAVGSAAWPAFLGAVASGAARARVRSHEEAHSRSIVVERPPPPRAVWWRGRKRTRTPRRRCLGRFRASRASAGGPAASRARVQRARDIPREIVCLGQAGPRGRADRARFGVRAKPATGRDEIE